MEVISIRYNQFTDHKTCLSEISLEYCKCPFQTGLVYCTIELFLIEWQKKYKIVFVLLNFAT